VHSGSWACFIFSYRFVLHLLLSACMTPFPSSPLQVKGLPCSFISTRQRIFYMLIYVYVCVYIYIHVILWRSKMTRLHVGCRLLPTSMDISMFTGFVRIIQHISTLWYQIHKITQIPIHHNSISNTTSNIIKPYVICPKKCRARAARGRTGDLVALSKLLRLPTHPDAARSSDGITALLSASCGAPAWHAMAMACRNSQDEMRRDETRCMEEFSWMRSCRSVCVIMCHLMSWWCHLHSLILRTCNVVQMSFIMI
jgi:hypothetical protein